LEVLPLSSFDLGVVLDFLSDLALNNERAWFTGHKADYEKARLIFEGFVDEVILRLSAFQDGLAGLRAKECIMRIYRDMRFSRDKTPYNTWMTSVIAPGGRKSGRFGYGLRLLPGGTMAGGGLWEPNSGQVAAFRRAVDRDPDAIVALTRSPQFLRTFGSLKGQKLSKAPQGYASDHPAIEILKLKQVHVVRSFPDEAVCALDFMDSLVETFRAMKPFLGFLDRAVP
jgi:uncharacterized protein (TIGR02453 family)